MNDEKVFQLLMETNPVPDPDGLDSPIALAQPVGRNPNMETSERISTEPTSTRPGRNQSRRSRLLIGAVAAALVLIVGLGTVAVIGGDGDTAVEPEVAVVLSAIEARNSGDIDAYIASLTGAELTVERNSNFSTAMSYANGNLDLVDCRLAGKARPGDSIVECQFTRTDDFYSTGGIVESGTAMFLVTEDDKISSVDDVGSDDIPWDETEGAVFNVAFFSWLSDAHPAVFEKIQSAGFNPGNIPGLAAFPGDPRDPAEMLIAVEYVAEFVAQSDVYPLNP